MRRVCKASLPTVNVKITKGLVSKLGKEPEAGETAKRLGTLADPAEDLDSLPSTHNSLKNKNKKQW